MEDKALKQLMEIDGVGKAKAKLLYDAGFKTIESVKNANEGIIAGIRLPE